MTLRICGVLIGLALLNFTNCKTSPRKDRIHHEHIEEDIISLVENTELYKRQSRLIDSLSSGKRSLSLLINLQDTTRNIYLVKAAEDNGISYVSWFKFLIDANQMIILNPSGKLDEE